MIECFLKLKYFYPNEYRKTIYDVDFKKLNDNGLEFVLIDLDNTLIPYDQERPDEKIRTMILQLKRQFKNVMIISNNHESRVKMFCDDLDCLYVYSAKKPLKSGFKKALKQLNVLDPKKVVLIGDQFMTDVFGGNRMGFYTIVVDAIKRRSEKWYTKINRRLEMKMMKRLKRRDPKFYQANNLSEKR